MIWKILYGVAFVVVLPILLFYWAGAAEINVKLDPYGSDPMGYFLTASGLALMLVAMWDLSRFGGGLPMNAFPPAKLVSRGLFEYVPHPIYAGFVATCVGVSMLVRSPAGLWLISPAMALCCTALVLGYERPDLQRRFGETLRMLPADDDSPPSIGDCIRFFAVVLIPWVVLFEFTSKMHLRGTAFQFGFEDRLPIYTWTAILYESTYLTVVAAPWLAATKRELRQMTISAWVASAVIFPFYWVMPSSAPRRPLEHDNWLARLLHYERVAYPPTAAFPSFHVIWAVLNGRCFRPRWLGTAYVVCIVVTCITTGQHFIPDVLAALLISPVFVNPEPAWKALRRVTERVANSWGEWRIGSVRIINYGLYAGLAGFVQVAMVSAAAGPGHEGKVLVLAVAGLLGAALWAQAIEGTSGLLRPFGFYGGFIAVAVACLFFDERWTLLGANVLAAPWMQSLGRLRCLVNGCCHGRIASTEIGIRVSESRSRVVRLANLRDVSIYPTQLYSILANVLLGLVLARMWAFECSLAMICGAYMIGSGCARFIEEAYRGEPQTMVIAGLRLYQWIAAASVVLGAILTTLQSPAAHPLVYSVPGIGLALFIGVLAAVAMGVDFPESNRRFARLT